MSDPIIYQTPEGYVRVYTKAGVSFVRLASDVEAAEIRESLTLLGLSPPLAEDTEDGAP